MPLSPGGGGPRVTPAPLPPKPRDVPPTPPQNLGNTCFMNSALQCLSQTPELTEFFVSGEYEKELNVDNPIGTGGELAKAYADLVRRMWQGNVSSVSPRLFKAKLGQFAQQFMGYRQQDSQELLAFLLDGLHEDLNRIKKKPFVEEKDSDGRPDAELAREAWANYRLRNDSVLVDTFQGLLKSELTCPTCKKTSVKFDPFMYLTLPLSRTPDQRSLSLTLAWMDGSSRISHHTVQVKQSATVRTLLATLRKEAGVPEGLSMHALEVWQAKVFKHMARADPVVDIREDDTLIAYAYPPAPSPARAMDAEGDGEPAGGERLLTVYQSARGPDGHRKNRFMGDLWGVPLLVALPVHGADVSAEEAAREDLEVITERVRLALGGSLRPGKRDEPGETPESDAARSLSSAFDLFQDSREGTTAVHRVPFGQPNPRRTSSTAGYGGFGSYTSTMYAPRGADSAGELYGRLTWNEDAETMYDISSWRGPGAEAKAQGAARVGASKEITLEECLEAFCQRETLDEENAWYCPRCKDFVQAGKKIDLWTLPDVLVVHLKRFSYNTYSRDKITTPVRFPIEGLNMAPFMLQGVGDRGLVYDLYAVSNHYGGMGGGHYTAFARHEGEKKWLCFDDSHVSSMAEMSPSAAYVLFYRRRGSKVPSIPTVIPSSDVVA